MKGKRAETSAIENEVRWLYGMRKHLKKKKIFRDHPTSTCSFTQPKKVNNRLDCERPVSSTACGGDHSQYGPEFSFGHVFPKLLSPLKGQKISITKVAVGGTTLFERWMKENKDNEDNYWYALVDAIIAARGTLEGFVWFQGENDNFLTQESQERYFDNLNQFVADIRQEIYNVSTNGKFASPSDIPVIIVEVGRWIWQSGGDENPIIKAQRNFNATDANARLVSSGAGDDPMVHMTQFYHLDLASHLIIGRRIAKAMADLINTNSNV